MIKNQTEAEPVVPEVVNPVEDDSKKENIPETNEGLEEEEDL